MREASSKQLYWTVCEVGVGCGLMRRVRDQTNAVRPTGAAIALAREHGGAPETQALVLVTGDLASLSGYRFQPGDATMRGRRFRLLDQRTNAAILMDTLSSISASFEASRGDRLLISWEESTGGGGPPRIWMATSQRSPVAALDQSPDAVPQMKLGFLDQGFWDYARFSLRFDSEGNRVYSTAPGHVYALVYDPREHIAPPPLGFLERRVRAFGTSMSAAGPELSFYATADGRPTEARFDYDDAGAIFYNLCNTIQRSSRGKRGAELRDVGLGPLRCATTIDLPETAPPGFNELIVGRVCKAPGCLPPDPQRIAQIANFLSRPTLFQARATPLVSYSPLPAPLPAELPAGSCFSGYEHFRAGYQATVPGYVCDGDRACEETP